MIIKTNFIFRGFDAVTAWPFIFIRPAMVANVPLVEHELVHYREMTWVTPIWWARYVLSKKFRFAAEVRAYKRQIELGTSVLFCANMLLKYKLNITLEEAVAALIA